MRQVEREYQEKISEDHEKARLELEAWKNELMSREKDLQKRQADNHNERNKLYLEKKHVIINNSLFNSLEHTFSDRCIF